MIVNALKDIFFPVRAAFIVNLKINKKDKDLPIADYVLDLVFFGYHEFNEKVRSTLEKRSYSQSKTVSYFNSLRARF